MPERDMWPLVGVGGVVAAEAGVVVTDSGGAALLVGPERGRDFAPGNFGPSFRFIIGLGGVGGTASFFSLSVLSLSSLSSAEGWLAGVAMFSL